MYQYELNNLQCTKYYNTPIVLTLTLINLSNLDLHPPDHL